MSQFSLISMVLGIVLYNSTIDRPSTATRPRPHQGFRAVKKQRKLGLHEVHGSEILISGIYKTMENQNRDSVMMM
jgi:hypothetical protein